jgi:hypothetical protein
MVSKRPRLINVPAENCSEGREVGARPGNNNWMTRLEKLPGFACVADLSIDVN